jgi:hypothetical protein
MHRWWGVATGRVAIHPAIGVKWREVLKTHDIAWPLQCHMRLRSMEAEGLGPEAWSRARVVSIASVAGMECFKQPASSAVPRQYGEHFAHATPIGDAGEDQACTDECGQAVETGVDPGP